mgnify:FL=1
MKMIEVNNVSMRFNMAKEKHESLKEYFLAAVQGKLQFEEFYALRDVSLTVHKGEFHGIIGLNGSGKSTLLKVISGVFKPTAGNVVVHGSIAPLIELGAGFDMDLTARENIYLNGTVLGLTPKYIDEKFDEIVDFSELREFLDVPLKNYSSGMVARIAFAIATITKPDVLIADEILSVGDFMFQEKCEERMRQLMSGGTTVLLVSHSIGQIERMCDHVTWLEKGRVKMQGEAAEESIIEALCNVAARPEKFDAVVLIRGGGSRSDLNCFNAYRLCAHVAQFPLPVVTGIGHDKDTSVADMVAHTALKTPTAVAGWLVERMAETDGWLDCAALQLNDMTKAAMHASEVRLERLSGEVRRLSGELLTRQTLRLEHFTGLLPDAARDFLARQGVRLGNAAELIAGRSPERILRLGFAVLRAGGRAVTSAGSVAEGEQVEIEVSDGKIDATVNSGKIWQKKK